jgi:two-component system, OmpR family, phosphate regulon sensor histidine kinase PhoR
MEEQNLYDVLVSNLPVGFSRVDKDGVIIEFNKAAESITGYSKEEVTGKLHLAILHGTTDANICPLFVALREGTQKIATQTTLRTKSEEYILVAVTAFPLFDSAGAFVGGVELFRDITKFKRLERERRNVLSMFAHDMKNPIITAEGFLSRVLSGKMGPLTGKEAEYLSVVKSELQIVERLLRDFLEFSKYETKEYRPAIGPFDIALAISGQIVASSVEADEKDIKIRFEYSGTPVEVNADAAMISRVIANLVDNAINYTGPGGTITVKLVERESDVLVQVEDTGVGIQEDKLPHVFDAFFRVDKCKKGTGLGLTIAKMIMEAHGGKIWLKSTFGKGSIFGFSLPKK